MKNSTKSQEKVILEHLESGRSITPIEALVSYGCFRLSARIHRLRNRNGIEITTKMVTTESGKLIARYSISKS